ncbi:MAG: 4Fe-4S binding protein [Myxococcales bacterium]|nr:4Fe-4S binding protein [Myxococcales bacterium]
MKAHVCQPPGDTGRNAPGTTAPSPAGFAEVFTDLSREEARAEARRCLGAFTCTYCEVCQLICPDQCITRDEASGEIRIDLDFCKGCGLCAAYCPKGALRMEREAGGG